MDQASLPQLFGIVPTGLPPITTPTTAPSPTSFTFTLPPRSPPYHHICVFLLPGITLPPDTAAAVYISLPSSSQASAPSFKFLGGIGPGKESAIFKINTNATNGGAGNGNGIAEVDMDSNAPAVGEITVGISVESASSVAAQMAALPQPSSNSSSNSTNSSQLVLARNNPPNQTTTLVLAQRIIKNAFNFLASFSGNMENGVEVVPLKAFEEWWKKFETRVRNDPGFLERDSD